MKLHVLTLLFLALVLFGSVVNAQDNKPATQDGKPATQDSKPTPTPELKVSRVWLYPNYKYPYAPVAGMGNTIVVEVDGLKDAVEKSGVNPGNFILYLNGQPLKGVSGVPHGPVEYNQVAFKLKRTDESKQMWSTLLGKPSFFQNLRDVTVSVGPPDKPYLFKDVNNPPTMHLRLYYGWWAAGAAIALLLLIAAFVLMARKGWLIRDSNPPKLEGKLKPYSLALSQAAFWFFLVIVSFILIYLVTGDYNTISDQALILMGIGTGTALGAAMVNITKRDTSDSELAVLRPATAKLQAEIAQLTASGADSVSLAEKQATLDEKNKQIEAAEAGLTKPASDGPIKDLLTDVNGVTLHRFQMMIWTIILGVLFVFGVYRELAMPEFSTTLLALMGISAGTYLGFKIPERQN